jgi:lysophospholipase L1-like esterase
MPPNRIYIFFIGLALLFWNPLAYYLIYRNSPSFNIRWIMVLYSLITLAGLGIVYLFHKNRIHSRWKNPLLSLSILGLLFALLTLFNSLIGKKGTQEKEGLIFVPGTQVRYKSVEFDYLVSINSLGLRDKEFNISKGDKFRILCLGDSWTIGWGVNLEETYPKQLEKYLQEKGKNVEVINCGQAGNYTTIYARQLKKLLPVLQPDLVLVGVLQGDDLAQLYEADSTFRMDQKKQTNTLDEIAAHIKTYLKSSLGNITDRFKTTKPITVQYNWEKSATSVINGFSPQQNLRFNLLEDTVQKLFRTGNLNPSLINFYLNFPERMMVFNKPDHPATRLAISRMNRDLEEMKLTCTEAHTSLVVVNMPMSLFTGHQVIRTPADILDPYFVANNKIDSIYRSLASSNNIPYFELTQQFISLPDKTGYFYRFDGHPNAHGYKEIARLVGENLLKMNW